MSVTRNSIITELPCKNFICKDAGVVQCMAVSANTPGCCCACSAVVSDLCSLSSTRSFGDGSGPEASSVGGAAWYTADDESAGAASALDCKERVALSMVLTPEGRCS